MPDIPIEEQQFNEYHNEFSGFRYQKLSIVLIHVFGLDAALMVADLASKDYYFSTRDEKDEEGYFFNMEEHREESTGLSPYKQREAIKILSNANIIDAKRKGIPPKLFFKINYELINKIHQATKALNLKNFKVCTLKNLSYINKLKLISLKELNKFNSNNGNHPDSREVENESPSPDRRKRSRQPTRPKQKKAPPEISNTDRAFARQCIKEWNDQPNVTRHRNNTATAKNIEEKIIWLLKGRFHQQAAISEAFMKSHDIPEYFLRREWPKDKIKEGILRLSKLAQPAYWPKDKQYFRNLDQLIYNGRKQTSWLLAVLRREPVPFAVSQAINPYPRVTPMFKNKCRENVNDAVLNDRLINNVSALAEEYKRLIENDRDGRFTARFPIFEKFCELYIDWADRNTRSFVIRSISPESGTYRRFYSEHLCDDFSF